jgi:hypothetical protein
MLSSDDWIPGYSHHSRGGLVKSCLYFDILPTTMNSSASSAHVKLSSDTSTTWEVIDILAERTSAGVKELLVVWTPEWIAKCQMDQSGPAMQKWKTSGLEKHIVKLPIVVVSDAESSSETDLVVAGSVGAVTKRSR